MGYRCFKEVAGVVEFVTEVFLHFPAPGADPGMGGVSMYGAEGVEVTIFFLGGANDGDEGIEIVIKGRVLLHLQTVGRAFDDLVEVSVIKGVFRHFITGNGVCRTFEIVNPAGLLALFQYVGDGDVGIDLYFGCPEAIGYLYLGEGNGLDRVVFFDLGKQGTGECSGENERFEFHKGEIIDCGEKGVNRY